MDLHDPGARAADAVREIPGDVRDEEDPERPVNADRHGEVDPDQADAEDDAGDGDRHEREEVEQTAAGCLRADRDPRDDRGEGHDDGRGRCTEQQAVAESAPSEVIGRDELVVPEGQLAKGLEGRRRVDPHEARIDQHQERQRDRDQRVQAEQGDGDEAETSELDPARPVRLPRDGRESLRASDHAVVHSRPPTR